LRVSFFNGRDYDEKNVPNYRQQPEYRRCGCEQREHKSIFDFAALRFAGSLHGAFPIGVESESLSTILTLSTVRRREN
jgi:hypothetical protein